MKAANGVTVGPLRESELEEADRIFRVAFGTYIGLPNPADFMGDRNLLISRWYAPHVKTLAARDKGRLIGSNQITRWGSFAFFGPLTVLPEYWDRGIAQRLLDATIKIFEKQGPQRTGLFTFPHSTKHVGLYQKYGYWPGYLTALMKLSPEDGAAGGKGAKPVYLTKLKRSERESAIAACSKLTNVIVRGLDLTSELRMLVKQQSGEAVMTYTRNVLDGFALCFHGAGTEGGTKTCYVKFAAARSGAAAGQRFDRVLDACIEFAASRAAALEAGMNLAREDAYRRMRAHGFRPFAQGVSMQRPHAPGHNRADAYVIDDWR
jgi:GNAT superfamily N-acetyltransferase